MNFILQKYKYSEININLYYLKIFVLVKIRHVRNFCLIQLIIDVIQFFYL